MGSIFTYKWRLTDTVESRSARLVSHVPLGAPGTLGRSRATMDRYEDAMTNVEPHIDDHSIAVA